MANNDLAAIRRQRLGELLQQFDNRASDLAVAIKKAPAQVSHWLNGHKNISEDTARSIETRLRKPKHWMDSPDDRSPGLVAEPTIAYQADAWPLPGISAADVLRLPSAARKLLTQQIKLLLSHTAPDSATEPTANTWRRAALALATETDAQLGTNDFTKFCLAVDNMLAQPTEKSTSASTAKRTRGTRHVRRDQ